MIPFVAATMPRPRFQSGGGDALVHFEVCGKFEEPLLSQGLPAGIEARVSDNDFARFDDMTRDLLVESDPEVAAILEAAPQVVTIFGQIADPATLDYLRDTLTFIDSLLASEGIGVVDPLTQQVFSPRQWRETFWSGFFEPTSHAVILVSMEEQGNGVWMHTRGLQLFGRPDLSCHHVRPSETGPIQAVFNGLIRMMAAGAIIPEGQKVRGVGLEKDLMCRYGEGLILELCWERGR